METRRNLRIIGMSLLALWAPAAAAQVPSFRGLGDLPGGDFFSEAFAVSADGRVVVGASSSESSGVRTEAFRWTAEEGIQPLGDLSGGVFFSVARDVSADGSLIVGRGASPQGEEAYVWERTSGMRGLGYMPGGTRSFAQGISADGAVIVGQGDSAGRTFEAFRWTQGGGFEGLGALENGRPNSVAEDVSADSSVAVGYSFMTTGSGNKAFRWTAEAGMELLDSQEDPAQAYGVSGDGSTAIGTIYAPFESKGVLWRNGRLMQSLGYLPGRFRVTVPAGISFDGGLVVGMGWAGNGVSREERAFIWDSNHGMRDLSDLLATEYGLNLDGWKLRGAADISPDGTVIVGYGTNPAGNGEAWVVVIPEPAHIGLFGLGLFLGLRRNRCSA